MSHESSLQWIETALAAWEQAGLRRHRITREGWQGATIRVDGNEVLNFGSNDYLGLAADPRLTAAVAATLQTAGWGAGASPLVTGRADVHAELEHRLAEFEQAPAALLFPSGFAANVGAVTALVDAGDVVYSDQKNHASLIDGCRLSKADVQIYRHGDHEHLAQLLKASDGFRRRLIVTDSLFSMDGDLAPLPQLVELAEHHQAMLLVDEAHATGVFGQQGRGVCEALHVEARVPVRVGTLSKALGCGGGFVVGSKPLIEWLANRARPYVFSTAQPAANAAAGLAALEIVAAEPERRIELLARAERLRTALRAAGWNVGTSGSQIIPIIIGDAGATMRHHRRLLEQGFFVPGIRPPSVPEGESLLRISLCYGHTDAAIGALLAALGSAANA